MIGKNWNIYIEEEELEDGELDSSDDNDSEVTTEDDQNDGDTITVEG